jgi:hypothetical protein
MFFFDSLSNSWAYARQSYDIIMENKRLLLLPILSSIALVLVLGSFLLPLIASGEISAFEAMFNNDSSEKLTTGNYVTMFLFYFCNYFVIVFFNAALVACAMQALRGEEVSLKYGLSMAARRWWQIIGWSLVSASVGLLLRTIERSNEKAARFAAGLLGMAWSAMTFFVVPVIVLQGAGPIESVKRSIGTLKNTWGTALMGNFSLGLMGFLLMLPVFAIAVLLVWAASSVGSLALAVMMVAVAVIVVVLGLAAMSAADAIFKALLFSYATEQTLPDSLDSSIYDNAFVSKA